MADQYVVFTATGGENDFNVSLPSSRANNTYFVGPALGGVTGVVGIDIPSGVGDRTTTQFRVVTTAPLTAGDRIEFHIYDPAVPPGMLIGTKVFAGPATSGTYTATAGTMRCLLRAVGGGGGGGGSNGSAGAGMAVGAGGRSGCFIERWIDPGAVIVGSTYARGAGGAGGANTGSAGGTGGDTTITINGTLYTAKGGTGGAGMVSASTSSISLPGAESTGSGPADFVMSQQGQPGVRIFGTGQAAVSGCGGSSPFGDGGISRTGSQVGAAPLNTTGGGGGGGGTSTTGAATGGTGASGMIVIYEYS